MADYSQVDMPSPARGLSSAPPFVSSTVAVLRRPYLCRTAVSAGFSLAPTGWWRRAPFLPLPDAQWFTFRMETAYGGEGRFDRSSPFRPEDLITWLEWRKEWPN